MEALLIPVGLGLLLILIVVAFSLEDIIEKIGNIFTGSAKEKRLAEEARTERAKIEQDTRRDRMELAKIELETERERNRRYEHHAQE